MAPTKAPELQAGNTLNITMRPREFVDVIGLEQQVAALQSLISSNSIPRALTLIGPFGCGKTTLAMIFAKAVQGFEFADAEPQVQDINAANFTGVDSMRQLVHDSHSYPMSGKYSIIILDEAHKLSKPAQELLLKEFEAESSPTIWIICTTDPQKLADGLKAGRCFTLSVKGMDAAQRAALVAKGAAEKGFTGDTQPFLAALTKSGVVSPRKILMALETYVAGISAEEAVGGMMFAALPEYFDICSGIVHGKWEASYRLPWLKNADGSEKNFPAVCDQLKALDDRLKKKPKDFKPVETDGDAPEIDDEDVQGKPEVANALLAMTAAMLKNNIAKESAKFNATKAQRAAEAIYILAMCKGISAYGLEYPAVLSGLYRAHMKMRELAAK